MSSVGNHILLSFLLSHDVIAVVVKLMDWMVFTGYGSAWSTMTASVSMLHLTVRLGFVLS